MGYAHLSNSSFIQIHNYPYATVTVNSVASDCGLVDITVPQLRGTLSRVTLDTIITEMQENSHANNYLDGLQYVQINDGTDWRDATRLNTGIICPADSYITGDFLHAGTLDIKAYINSAGTYSIRMHNVKSLANFLFLRNVSCRLNFYFE